MTGTTQAEWDVLTGSGDATVDADTTERLAVPGGWVYWRVRRC